MMSNDEQKYNLLFSQIESLLNPEEPIITNISNSLAAIKQTFSKVSWVGIYFTQGDTLYLGPFQGKVACTMIKIGDGVCGNAAKSSKSIVVEDVDKFPGHIVCDVESKSEIVIPLIHENINYGVLDLDSTSYSAFNEIDRVWLEKICKLILTKLNLNKNLF